jgi:enterochelin esterase-like enzyme
MNNQLVVTARPQLLNFFYIQYLEDCMKVFSFIVLTALLVFAQPVPAFDQQEQKESSPSTVLSDLIKANFPNISEKDLRSFAFSKSCDEPYGLGKDSKKQDGVPEGAITKYHWVNKKIYIGTQRDYWLYVPKQYDPSKPACLMIFQDADYYLGPDVQSNVVFDNLIYKADIPIIIGLFIGPGDVGPGLPLWGGKGNRSVEYDTVSNLYPRFLIEEIIPEIKKNYNITDDPAGRAIVGISSGGLCAFNAAWQRADAFGKVISHCGSFVNIRGGDKYPEMIRMSPKKPIRIFLQSGEKDANLIFGSWALKNKETAAALEYSGYDYKFVFGEGGHTLMHGGAIFPNTLRWLWCDYPKQ